MPRLGLQAGALVEPGLHLVDLPGFGIAAAGDGGALVPLESDPDEHGQFVGEFDRGQVRELVEEIGDLTVGGEELVEQFRRGQLSVG